MAQKDINMMSEVKPKAKVLVPLLILALVIAIAVAGYLYWQNMQLTKNPQSVAQKQTKDLVERVSNLILLPEDETPTVATVTDPELLKDQPFFSKAVKGDQILIYTNAKQAILYRASTNMIINVAPLNIGSSAPATNQEPAK